MKEKERGFQPEPQFLRRIRRIVRPRIDQESSERYLESRKKRGLDLLVSFTGLPLGGLTILVSAGVNKLLERKEPVFYQTTRLGKDGKEIRVLKIRSMKSIEAEETKVYGFDPKRINLFGQFLRRSAIDELPQLFSIIAGELSLVGSRAMPDHEMEGWRASLAKDVFEDWRKIYLAHKPGGTSLMLLLGNADLSSQQRVRLDQFYATHANLRLDLYILFATPLALIRGRGIR